MVGGDRKAFEASLDVYKAMGGNIVYIGESGHGQLTKMINQSIMNAIYCSVTENFAFAAAHGMDLERVYAAIENGGAKSGLLSAMKQTILSGVPVEDNNLKIMSKDCDYMTEECNRESLFMPVQAASQQVLNIGRKKGFSKYWTGSIFLIWEELMGKKFKAGGK
jgi:3-hydroxyisobutyrate dehydrogenase-like beta-hydroxyacid dehydrogenase